MEIRELICINCPMGCQLQASLEDGKVVSVTGNTCPRGEEYARNEVVHPVRIITSSIPVSDGDLSMVSCRTDRAVDKDRIFYVMRAMKSLRVQAPVCIGQVLAENIADSGANLVATREIRRKI